MEAIMGNDDILTEKIINVLMGHNDTVSKLAFSLDGRFLAVGLFNGGIFIWEMPPVR